ncbi:hypothetical protein HG535_0A07160 [Zygotorulaspora mrakii]|uniref:Uncharacterized protein n=1 Tax=Zygotorulaspora mrakii TaxID=42260 RepID=A0A7H9AXF4_ZYGMR|nr:uncharacterized protein HG535_0A07160 [Zygotorulaspora mrakii]QLG70774.1 hypothetical protein HG535_0A07160 [Zygotorulaspora mrakii]
MCRTSSIDAIMFKNLVPRCTPKIFFRSYQIPTTTRKIIPIYSPVEKIQSSNILERLSRQELDTKLDPNGWRRKIISKSKNSLNAGDVVRVVYDAEKCSYDNFVGYVLSVDRKRLIQDASVLLRNQIAKTSVEVRVPIFSPLVERIDVLRKSDSRRKRNKHYYIRGTKLDVGDLEAGLRKKR